MDDKLIRQAYREYFKALEKADPEAAKWFRETSNQQITMDHKEIPTDFDLREDLQERLNNKNTGENQAPIYIPTGKLTRHQQDILNRLKDKPLTEVAADLEVSKSSIYRVVKRIKRHL